MILLDASTIIDGLRAKDVSLIERMRSVDGAVCGVTRAEVLAGSRSDEHRAKLLTILDSFNKSRFRKGTGTTWALLWPLYAPSA